MLKIVRVSALILTLACVARAGDAPNNVMDDPTPPRTIISAPEPAKDAEHLPDTTAESFGETLLSFIDSVLALF